MEVWANNNGSTASRNTTEHVVMFPFMAQGHITPFFALAKFLERRTPYTITLVNTPLNIQKLRSSLPSDTTINLAELPFNGSDHGLPPNSENTDFLPSHLIIRLAQSSETLQPAFEELICDISNSCHRSPLCIIGDVFLGWTVQSAQKFKIFHATFTTCGAYGTAAYTSIWLHLPQLHTASDCFHIPGFPEAYRIHRTQLSESAKQANGSDPWTRFLQRQILHAFSSGGMLCNTVEEIEKSGVEILRTMTRLPIGTVGRLLPTSLSDSAFNRSYSHPGKEPGISVDHCVEWLNLHRPNSVLYLSFGSQNTISDFQIMELAKGLEASRKPFIWVIRPPIGNDINGDFRPEWMPEGFEDRMRKRMQGILVRKWGPQMEILSHKSTGAFLSHCGWNSTLESLSLGVPIIGWPLAADQFYNSKMMEEEMGVCVELGRGIGDEVDADKVERVVNMVIGKTEKGKEMKRKAAGVREILRAAVTEEEGRKGSSLIAINDFINTALSMQGSSMYKALAYSRSGKRADHKGQ